METKKISTASVAKYTYIFTTVDKLKEVLLSQ
jgi:hypothetical protein